MTLSLPFTFLRSQCLLRERRSEGAMGLDGGTIPSRADILRRSSWRLANTSTSRSSRGGMLSYSCSCVKCNAVVDVSLYNV